MTGNRIALAAGGADQRSESLRLAARGPRDDDAAPRERLRPSSQLDRGSHGDASAESPWTRGSRRAAALAVFRQREPPSASGARGRRRCARRAPARGRRARRRNRAVACARLSISAYAPSGTLQLPAERAGKRALAATHRAVSRMVERREQRRRGRCARARHSTPSAPCPGAGRLSSGASRRRDACVEPQPLQTRRRRV